METSVTCRVLLGLGFCDKVPEYRLPVLVLKGITPDLGSAFLPGASSPFGSEEAGSTPASPGSGSVGAGGRWPFRRRIEDSSPKSPPPHLKGTGSERNATGGGEGI